MGGALTVLLRERISRLIRHHGRSHTKPLISELKNFVAHGISYAAKPGETDDLVMSTVLAVRMMQVLQSYHQELDGQMTDHEDNSIEPMPFVAVF